MKYVGIGIGPGMGFSTAEKFGREGYDLVITGRDVVKLRKLGDELSKKTGRKVETVQLDASDLKSVEALAAAHGSSTSVLHYNAAAMHNNNLFEVSTESLAKDITADVTGALVAVKSFGAPMREKKEGTILLTGGALALFPNFEYLTLSIGKAGLRSMTEALFPEFAKFGVHVATVTIEKCVSPGAAADAAADAFCNLHKEAKDVWTWELVLK